MPRETHAQNRDMNWHISLHDDGTYPSSAVTNFLLMDLREELQRIRRVLESRLNCYETMQIPGLLRAIKKNTTKKRRTRKKVTA